MRIFTLTVFLLGFTINYLSAQKIPLNFSVYDDWQYIESPKISADGKYLSYEINPFKGDGTLFLYDTKKNKYYDFPRGKNAEISPESDFAAYRIKPQHDTIRQMKIDGKTPEEFPDDSLGIHIFKNDKTIKIPNVKSFAFPEKESSFLVYTFEKEKEKNDSTEEKTTKLDKSAPESHAFAIFFPDKEQKYEFENISNYSISENGKLVSFVKLRNDSILSSKLYIFNTRKQKLDSLPETSGIIDKISCSNQGDKFAFLHTEDSVKRKVYTLYYWDDIRKSAKVILDSISPEIPENWTVSPNRSLRFSDNGSKLYFGIAPKPELPQKDSLPDDEKVKLDIWHWNDTYIQSEQLVRLPQEKKRTYLTVYHCNTDKIVQLADEKLKNISLTKKANADILLASNYEKYAKIRTWDVSGYRDVYTVNTQSGKRKKVLERHAGSVYLSPKGKSIVYFTKQDSTWRVLNTESGKHQNLTSGLSVSFSDEEHDYPALPHSYGIAGFTSENEVWVYDRYDIWQINFSENDKPLNITQGRKQNIRFRYLKLNPEAEYINSDKVLLSAFSFSDKKSGYYRLENKKKPEKIVLEDFSYNRPKKAEDDDALIFRKENTKNAPDIYLTDIDFKKVKKITNINPQQEKYLWAESELVRWQLPDGSTEEGLLYKPENFSPDKKYPVLVYFYRLYSDRLNMHWAPRPSRSIINPTFYASNGYLVFIPNIRYETGHPGKSALKYVLSGTKALTKKTYADKERIGIQGQSWGGYQVAYIITQTDFFKAAAAGAPVSNMFSAYGGIRKKSGMSRAFQYEKTQSRIGATPWEAPELYIENSPVFHAPKINTPLLMMHNDNDGAVPWHQGIEMYIAMRRLGKPAWLLNYNNEPHNLSADSPARKDLSKRLMQFFDTYLKNEPMPVWLKEGIPAIKKGKEYGFEPAD